MKLFVRSRASRDFASSLEPIAASIVEASVARVARARAFTRAGAFTRVRAGACDARAGVRRRVVEDWAIARLGDARGGWRLRAERCGRARLRLITTSDGYDDEER